MNHRTTVRKQPAREVCWHCGKLIIVYHGRDGTGWVHDRIIDTIRYARYAETAGKQT